MTSTDEKVIHHFYPWIRFLHPWLILTGKTLSMDKIFSSMDRILICHSFVLTFYVSYIQMRILLQMALGIKFFLQFSAKNMVDDFFIHGCHRWMKSRDEDDR